MGRLTSDTQGHATLKSKWLDIRTWDPVKIWASAFFFIRNDWGLLEKWGKMWDLLAPLHVGEEDIMRLLKDPDVGHLLYKVRYLNKYIEEEFLLKRAQAMITQLHEDQKASVEKVAVLEAENKRSHTLITEKEAALTSFESSRDRIQEARDHIYEIEVKALEQQYIDEGFTQSFLKGVHLVRQKTAVEVKGLTPSQASNDSPLNSDGDEIESEL
ncbi:hypothetical protein IEQ34_000278 [Dendrobium chrysotoxum]|uniref:Uncharacterized protein n=1 Tax=Dendrobium chrysotoxum TaxID=161865 RepID=A0AAV7HTJ4_DENCH|nr:hypothetical protein IEQ34_000278 [Dendrobium chrysotoxum]